MSTTTQAAGAATQSFLTSATLWIQNHASLALAFVLGLAAGGLLF